MFSLPSFPYSLLSSSLTIHHSVGALGAGGVTNLNPSGWRNIFWMQAAFHLASTAGLLIFYSPPRHSDYPKMSLREYIWACDPIGTVTFVFSATLLLLALDWAGGSYAWADPHVAAPLALGLVLLVAFAGYGMRRILSKIFH